MTELVGLFQPCFSGSDAERSISKLNTILNMIFPSPVKTERHLNQFSGLASRVFLTWVTGGVVCHSIVLDNTNERL